MNGSEVSFNAEKEKFEPRIPDQNFDDIGGLENEKACYQSIFFHKNDQFWEVNVRITYKRKL